MKSKIKKYLDKNKEFRIYTTEPKGKTIEDDLISLSSMSSILLSQDERITFNFKSKNGDKIINTDIYSDYHFSYKINNQILNNGLLFVTKSKLKNFGASYNTILDYNTLNLINIFEDYYNQSEQMEVFIDRIDNYIVLIQPLPFFNWKNYEQIKLSLYHNLDLTIKDCILTGNVAIDYQTQV
ncbi:Hsp33 family molecular chaperone HslO [Macrococcoides canis]|uniref:Hsp33 family molecular chaperone HslO n=1 Tax=Macrococcoides canis TaxID=1855823 RepID=UPI00165EA1D5|nr:Hsp33 family molecular chaperone HslO [Macrococcus canis]QNR06987.1 hypothetical protein GL258_01515 [Macrococcus canis]